MPTFPSPSPERPCVPIVELSPAVAERTRHNVVTFGETYARIHVVNCARSLDDALTAGDLVEGAVLLAILRETVRALPAGPAPAGTL